MGARHDISHDGFVREYFVHASKPATPGPMPLVIELHGGRGSGRNIDRLGRFAPLSDRTGFAVVSPSAMHRIWNDGRRAERLRPMVDQVDDIGFIGAVIDDVSRLFPIDPDRIYAVGISNGAMMTAALAGALAHRIAAFGQVAGTIAVEAAATWNPGRPVPIIQIHGSADPLVPYEGGPIGGGRRRGPLAGRGSVVGVEAWMAMVCRNNGVGEPAVAHHPGGVIARAWRGPTGRCDVGQWTIEGAGHVWPGGPQYAPKRLIGPTTYALDATSLIWQFFAAHALR